MPSRKEVAAVERMLDRARVLNDEASALLAATHDHHAQHAEQLRICDEAIAEAKALNEEIKALQSRQDTADKIASGAIAEMRRLTAETKECTRRAKEKIEESRALRSAVEARLKGEKPS